MTEMLVAARTGAARLAGSHLRHPVPALPCISPWSATSIVIEPVPARLDDGCTLPLPTASMEEVNGFTDLVWQEIDASSTILVAA